MEPLTRDQATRLVHDHLRAGLRLPDEPLGDDRELDLLPGADSVRVMRVLAAMEHSLGVRLDDDEVRRVSTVGSLVDLVMASTRAGAPR